MPDKRPEMRWPDRETELVYDNGKKITVCRSYEDAIKDCQSAFAEYQKELREYWTVEKLAKLIHENYWNTKFDEAIEIDINSAFIVAQAIRREILGGWMNIQDINRTCPKCGRYIVYCGTDANPQLCSCNKETEQYMQGFKDGYRSGWQDAQTNPQRTEP